MNNNIKYKSLDQVLELLQNGYSGKQSDEKKGYPISRIETLQEDDLDIKRIKYADLTEDEVLKYKYDEGDLIFSHINSFEKVGKIALFQNQVPNLIHGVNLLRMKFINGIYPKYAYYFFLSNHSRRQYEPNIKKAINQASLNQRNLKKIRFPMVDFLKQRRIVSKLDALFAEIDASLALIDQNMEQAEALMGSYLDQEFDKAKTENIPLKKLSNKVQYGYTGKSKEKGEYYYLRITDIQDGRVDYSQAPFSDISKDEVPKYLLKKGDILFARTGATAGKSYLFNDEEDAVFASYLIRVDAKREVLSPEYLKWFFQSDNYWAQIFGSIVGAAQPNFNGTKLKNMIIPVPKMDVQLVLAEKFNAMNKEIEQLTQSYIQKRANLEALKSSLLDSAFKGEL